MVEAIPSGVKKENNKHNVILITIDCLRADHVSILGYGKNTTTNIDKFADEGCLFTQAIANGSSTPTSFPSIFTSSYPLMYTDYPYLSSVRTLIPEVLKNHGYNTAGYHSNPYLSKYFNYHRGFDDFQDFMVSDSKLNKSMLKEKIKKTIKKNEKLFDFARNVINMKKNFISALKPIALPYQRADVINKNALSWLEELKGHFFLWIHYMDTHHPFFPPDKFCDCDVNFVKQAEYYIKNPDSITSEALRDIISLYDGTIRYVDYILGTFLKEIKNMDLFNNTMIIITADHGEEFKEHGGLSHKAKLYEELIHVPLMIRAPGLPKGIRIEEPVPLIDLGPTILDYLGMPGCSSFMGQSMIPLLTDGENRGNDNGIISETLIKKGKVSLSIEEGYRVTSYRTRDWKYIYNEESKYKELYRLVDDPMERINLSEKEKDKCREFDAIVKEHNAMEERTRQRLDERNKIGRAIAKIKRRGKYER